MAEADLLALDSPPPPADRTLNPDSVVQSDPLLGLDDTAPPPAAVNPESVMQSDPLLGLDDTAPPPGAGAPPRSTPDPAQSSTPDDWVPDEWKEPLPGSSELPKPPPTAPAPAPPADPRRDEIVRLKEPSGQVPSAQPPLRIIVGTFNAGNAVGRSPHSPSVLESQSLPPPCLHRRDPPLDAAH